MVVKLIKDVEPRHVPIEEAKARPVEQGVEAELLYELLDAVVFAARKYDPKWQCVQFPEEADCCTISIVGYGRSEVGCELTSRMLSRQLPPKSYRSCNDDPPAQLPPPVASPARPLRIHNSSPFPVYEERVV